MKTTTRCGAMAVGLMATGLLFSGAGSQGRTDPAVPVPPAGGAIVWYLGHCGYAVRTPGHFLIFDYQEERDGPQPKARPEKPSLSTGWIVPSEIKDLMVRVFVSHSHADHYGSVIHGWEGVIPDIAYYFGWKVSDDPSLHGLVGPRAGLASDGLSIDTINSHHSGVPEVAWLVKVDGLTIYHNGDCQPPDPGAEYGYLRTKTDGIDLAFLPPLMSEDQQYGVQNRLLLSKFRVRAAFPMHVAAGGQMYLDFQKDFRAEFPDTPVFVPMRMGQRFVYENGGITD
jgi:L-ascorbate metabolism protein UlaG (beta-lactamase superfamily)